MDLSVLSHYVVPLIIIAVAIGVAVITFFVLKFISHHAKKTKNTLDDEIMYALRYPASFIILSIGLYIALKFYNPNLAFKGITVNFIFTIIWILLAAYGFSSILKAVLYWYEVNKTRGRKNNTIFRFMRRIIVIVIYIIAIMIILDKAGIEISPMLAGLGIAGLAVALALEDTLKNFFSALYIAADRPVKIGDYVEIDQETRGYVEDIGWRSTKIRTLGNNFIIVPNSTLASSILKNYDDPQTQMSVLVNCGVAYNSDLEKVEKITLKTAKKILSKVEGAVSDYEPLIRFNEFGDSSINFTVVLRVTEFVNQYLIKHEFIKELHKEFKKNKIEIPFPQMDLYIKQHKKR